MSSSVFTWPDKKTVEEAVRRWAAAVVEKRPAVVQVGYFGSYARGDWGVGSDLDLIIILQSSDRPFEVRAAEWDTGDIPVPTDILVYTQAEWRRLLRGSLKRLAEGIVWLAGHGK